MRPNSSRLTITCKCKFERYTTAAAATGSVTALLTQKTDEKELSVRILVTDAETRTYSTLASLSEGETMPTGIAQAVYDSLSVLQYQGSDVRVQSEIANAAGDGPLLHLAHKLNLSGGRSAWASMDAQIQRITEQDGNGYTSITFGAAKHISAGDLAEMFQWNRWRRYWYNPKLRETAELGGSGSLQLGKDMPKENTSHGAGEDNLIAASYTVTV